MRGRLSREQPGSSSGSRGLYAQSPAMAWAACTARSALSTVTVCPLDSVTVSMFAGSVSSSVICALVRLGLASRMSATVPATAGTETELLPLVVGSSLPW